MEFLTNKNFDEITFDDIENLVNSGAQEGPYLDFKGEALKPDKLAKLVAGFANTDGGYAIFGVKEIDDDGDKQYELCGFDDEAINGSFDENITNAIFQNVYPVPSVKGPKKLLSEDGLFVWLLYIPKSFDKPHIISGDGRFYVRYNCSSKPASRIEVEKMFSEKLNSETKFQQYLDEKKLNPEYQNFLNSSPLGHAIIKNPAMCEISQDMELPEVNISLIPYHKIEEKLVDTSSNEFRGKVVKHANSQNLPYDFKLFDWHNINSRYDIDNVTFFHKIVFKGGSNDPVALRDYFKIYNNLHLSANLSFDLFVKYDTQPVCLLLTPFIAFVHKFIEFAKLIFINGNYHDKVYVQISFKNIQRIYIRSFYDERHEPVFNEESPGFGKKNLINELHKNFVIKKFFNLLDFDEEKIIELLMEIEKELLLIYGQNTSLAFKDRKINNDKVSGENWRRASVYDDGTVWLENANQ